MTKYFAVVNWPKGKLTPMIDGSVGGGISQLSLWDSEDEAKKTMNEQPLGKQYGYEIYKAK